MESLYVAAGGDQGMLALAHAWHERVLADEVVAHAFSHGFHAQHTERLAAYWAEALGGPTRFSSDVADESAVVRMHSGNGKHDEMNDRAIDCFDGALGDVGVGLDSRLGRSLHDYFVFATAAVSRYEVSADDVPDGLPIPHWTWEGPVS